MEAPLYSVTHCDCGGRGSRLEAPHLFHPRPAPRCFPLLASLGHGWAMAGLCCTLDGSIPAPPASRAAPATPRHARHATRPPPLPMPLLLSSAPLFRLHTRYYGILDDLRVPGGYPHTKRPVCNTQQCGGLPTDLRQALGIASPTMKWGIL